MSSGHASHKSTSAKPNPNAVNGQNMGEEEQDIQPETGYPFDADSETATNPAAFERDQSEAQS
jgi:hypothetical protein